MGKQLENLLAKMNHVCDIDKLSFMEKLSYKGHVSKALINTYAQGINPEAVPDLLSACKLALFVMEKNEAQGMDFGVEKIALINAIKKAE